MHLWNDYEGTTVAGRWTLGPLLKTEGRSALFSIADADGSPSVLRLTEALNDQSVLAARYRLIQSAASPDLIIIRSFGEAELDGTPLAYAVLEPTQESLADIIAVRRLGADEVHEVATNVAGGLAALHAQGLVHGHVEPESVVAAGDRIKLRSDCARPAPEPGDEELEGVVTKHTDAVGLAGIIYRALTQKRLGDAADALALAEPFSSIVRNTLRGTWGIAEIQTELTRPVRPVTPAAISSPAPAPARPSAAVAPVVAPLAAASTPAWQQPEKVPAEKRRFIGVGVAAVAVLILLFVVFHHPAHAPKPAPAPTQRNAAQEAAAATAASPLSVPAPQPPAAAAAVPAPGSGPGHEVWRVIAFDYNHQSQAAKKAASINRRFPTFHAQVWSRTGHRPYLVILGGGSMSKAEAFSTRARARHQGISRDVYAQNYDE